MRFQKRRKKNFPNSELGKYTDIHLLLWNFNHTALLQINLLKREQLKKIATRCAPNVFLTGS